MCPEDVLDPARHARDACIRMRGTANVANRVEGRREPHRKESAMKASFIRRERALAPAGFVGVLTAREG